MGFVLEKMDVASDAIATVARWRHEEWLHEFGFTLAGAERQLVELLEQNPPDEFSLLARLDGRPVGTCLLVTEELDQQHQVSPWLAGLYVAPEYRGRGIGAALVRGIEERAGKMGVPRVHLYTGSAEPFYAKLGWQVIDRFDWDGDPSVFMSVDLADI
jgi:predicted N-acetyltransferase YhbS